MKTLTITVQCPEGYDDVNVDLCVEDMQIHADFIILEAVDAKD
jgi:hypothetical protein